MSSNTLETTAVLTLTSLTSLFNRYLSIVILLFGSIGNILNYLAFSDRVLPTNPCSFLFLTLSITNLITLMSGVTVRLLNGWLLDLTDTVNWLCKIRIFILFTCRTITSWLIMLATYDRWLLTSLDIHRRQMSTLKNAQRGLFIISIVSCFAYVQVFYCYEANLTNNTPLKCYGHTAWCRLLMDSEFALISTLIPWTFMFIFGLLTIFNLRQVAVHRSQFVTITNISDGSKSSQTTRRLQKIDQSLLRMLCTQVVLLVLFSLPQIITSLYLNGTQFQLKTSLQTTIEELVLNLSFLLIYITNGMPFFIYTLTGGDVFRRALKHASRDLFRKIIKCCIV